MRILYQASDIEEAINKMLTEAWPRTSSDWSDWQKIRIRIQTAGNIVRNFYQNRTYEQDTNLVEVMDDLNVLYGIVVIRGMEIEQRSSPREAA